MSDPLKEKWVVRKTIDETGDYPVPTYDILAIHDYGPEIVACAFQNPIVANLIAVVPAIPVLLEALREAEQELIGYEINFESACGRKRNYKQMEADGAWSETIYKIREAIKKAEGKS